MTGASLAIVAKGRRRRFNPTVKRCLAFVPRRSAGLIDVATVIDFSDLDKLIPVGIWEGRRRKSISLYYYRVGWKTMVFREYEINSHFISLLLYLINFT